MFRLGCRHYEFDCHRLCVEISIAFHIGFSGGCVLIHSAINLSIAARRSVCLFGFEIRMFSEDPHHSQMSWVLDKLRVRATASFIHGKSFASQILQHFNSIHFIIIINNDILLLNFSLLSAQRQYSPLFELMVSFEL